MIRGHCQKLILSVLHSKKQTERDFEVGSEICHASCERDIGPTATTRPSPQEILKVQCGKSCEQCEHIGEVKKCLVW